MRQKYEKTVWVDGKTPINSTNLNKIEHALADIHTSALTPSEIVPGNGITVKITEGREIEIALASDVQETINSSKTLIPGHGVEIHEGSEPTENIISVAANIEEKMYAGLKVGDGLELSEVKEVDPETSEVNSTYVISATSPDATIIPGNGISVTTTEEGSEKIISVCPEDVIVPGTDIKTEVQEDGKLKISSLINPLTLLSNSIRNFEVVTGMPLNINPDTLYMVVGMEEENQNQPSAISEEEVIENEGTTEPTDPELPNEEEGGDDNPTDDPIIEPEIPSEDDDNDSSEEKEEPTNWKLVCFVYNGLIINV